jgi:PCFT/HCP family folate transporter-like MFS transporter 1/3
MTAHDDSKAHEFCKNDAVVKRKKMPQQIPDDSHDTWKTMSIVPKAKFVLKNCTIEPMFGCYIMTSVLTSMCTQNLNLQKACRVNLMLNDTVCSALETQNSKDYGKEEVRVQELVADMMIWKTLVQSSIPAVLIMFVGSWSDRNCRRKPCMMMPIVGELLTSLGLLVCTYYFYEMPVGIVGLVECLPPAMTGGWMTMDMAVFSYIGDVSSVSSKCRTSR